MITKVAFVAHPTHDMEQAKRFYGELLGLTASADYGDLWAEFKTPDGKTIALDTMSPRYSDSPSVYMALETDDIQAETERLREQGVEIVRDVWMNKDDDGQDVCQMAIITDSEGNGIMLHQIAAGRIKTSSS